MKRKPRRNWLLLLAVLVLLLDLILAKKWGFLDRTPQDAPAQAVTQDTNTVNMGVEVAE